MGNCRPLRLLVRATNLSHVKLLGVEKETPGRWEWETGLATAKSIAGVRLGWRYLCAFFHVSRYTDCLSKAHPCIMFYGMASVFAKLRVVRGIRGFCLRL